MLNEDAVGGVVHSYRGRTSAGSGKTDMCASRLRALRKGVRTLGALAVLLLLVGACSDEMTSGGRSTTQELLDRVGTALQSTEEGRPQAKVRQSDRCPDLLIWVMTASPEDPSEKEEPVIRLVEEATGARRSAGDVSKAAPTTPGGVLVLLPGADGRSIGIEFVYWNNGKRALDEALLGAPASVQQGPDKCAPDLVEVGSTWVWDLRDALEDVQEGIVSMVGPPGEWKDTYERLIAGARLGELKEGRALVAVPWFFDIRLLFARRDILNEHLGSDWTEGAGRLNGKNILDTCDELAGRGQIPLGLVLGRSDPNILHASLPLIWSQGSSLFRWDPESPRPSAAAEARAFVDGAEIFRRCGPAGLNKRRLLSQTEVDRGILSGEFAMAVTGTWLPLQKAVVSGVADRLVPVPIPSLAGKRPVVFAGGSVLALVKKKERTPESRAMATRVLAALASPNGSLAVAVNIGVLPGNGEAFDHVCRSHEPYWPICAVLAETDFASYPATPAWGQSEQYIPPLLAEMFMNAATWRDLDVETAERWLGGLLRTVLALAEGGFHAVD